MEAAVVWDARDYGVNEKLKWIPLEEILLSFIEMIEQKRIVAVSIYFDFGNPQEPRDGKIWEQQGDFFTPWILSEDDDKIVDDTVLVWDSLLSALKHRSQPL
jgi:hypothetical protein